MTFEKKVFESILDIKLKPIISYETKHNNPGLRENLFLDTVFSTISCHTSKSHHPQNVTACFSQLIPINATLEVELYGKGSTTMYIA